MLHEAQASGQTIDAVERGEPGLEDAFISLIEKNEKLNATSVIS